MRLPHHRLLLCGVGLVVTVAAIGCGPSTQTAEHHGWVHSYMTTDAPAFLPDALEGEVMQESAWTTSGVGSVYGQTTTNLRQSSDSPGNYCGGHGPLNLTWNDGPCTYSFPLNDSPWGAMEMETHRQYSQDLGAAPVSYSSYHAVTIHAKLRIEHRSGNNKPNFVATCPHEGSYYGSSGFFCEWGEQN